MKRRKARELALMFLYQAEMRNAFKERMDVLLNEFWEEQNVHDAEIKEFSGILVRGTFANLPLIDREISSAAINWSIKRMPCLDKNVLRIATFELLCLDDMPVLVSINEAIELAKKYSDEESPKFINGVLHKIKERLNKEDVKNDKIKTPPNNELEVKGEQSKQAQSGQKN